MRGDSGMTLMELLVVISILGLLVTVMLPFQGRMSDNVKKEETVQLLESIRFGLLGAENAYDAHGNRVLGGYVGDYGSLPEFVVHEWDTSTEKWSIPKHASEDKPQIVAISESYVFDKNIMPLGLWTNTLTVEGITDPHLPMAHNEWNGPYVVPPRDDFKNDDDIYSYSTPTDSDETRHFLLRQGTGRLTDGWGSSLLVYFDDQDPPNLYFVSAGSDRRINFGTVGSSGSTDFGPIDPTLPNNEDNLVLLISHEQWNLTDQKIALTKQKLSDIKTALLGNRGSVTDGISQPNGFVADIGGFEVLTGSYVYDSTTSAVYKCLDDHTSSGSSFSPSSDWQAVTGGSTGKTIDDYPHAPEWVTGRQYYAARPQLLLSNADYVYVKEEVPAGSGKYTYTYYRCIQSGTGQNPTVSSSSYWVEDATFEGAAWIPEYGSTVAYENEILTPWKYYKNVGFGAGWRSSYIAFSTSSLEDAWGEQIAFEYDTLGLLMRSAGPDKSLNTADDITQSIHRTEYEVPLTIIAKPSTSPVITPTSNDYVSLYSAFNGDIALINVQIDSTNVNDGKFLFTDERRANMLPELLLDATSSITTGASTIPNPSMYTSGGIWISIGRATAVYFNVVSGSYTSHSGYLETFTLHPRTDSEATLGD